LITGHIRSTTSPAVPGMQHGWPAGGGLPPHGLQQQQQQQCYYSPYAMMGAGWYPYPAYGLPGGGPTAVGVGLGLRRGGSGSSRQRAAAAQNSWTTAGRRRQES
jgi:hypothetical protein